MSASHVLIIDDDAELRRTVAIHLKRSGRVVHQAEDVASGLRLLDETEPDLVLTDLSMPDGTGLNVVRAVREKRLPCGVVVITGYGTIPTAVTALELGADNFLTKPLDLDVLDAILAKAEDTLILKRQSLLTASSDSAVARLRESRSPAMASLLDLLPRLARSDGCVVIQGETGTGKTLIAQALHELSPRAARPFVELNCATLSKELLETELFGHAAGAFTGATQAKAGLMEAADGGTLFLDEIADMDVEVQPKLLKVLEDKSIRRVGSVRGHVVDVRTLVATHRDLTSLVGDGKFREDLLFRLNVLQLALPPLRERREDVAPLAKTFLAKCVGALGEQRGFSADAVDWLEQQPWPGNVRELRNVVERAAVHCDGDLIQLEHLMPPLPFGSARKPAADDVTSLAEVEWRHLRAMLDRANGNKTKAAELLGIARQTLNRKLNERGQTNEESTGD